MVASLRDSSSTRLVGSELVLRFKTSRQLLSFIFVVHCLALLVIIFLAIPWLWKMGLCGLVMIVGTNSWLRHYRHGGSLLRRNKDLWYWSDGGEQQRVNLIGESFVSGWLVMVLIEFEETRQKKRLLILPDSADAQAIRRLRVMLKTTLA